MQTEDRDFYHFHFNVAVDVTGFNYKVN